MKCELICVTCILPLKESSTAYSLPSLCEFTSLFRYKKAEYCTTLANTQCLLLQHTLTSNQLYLKKKNAVKLQCASENCVRARYDAAKELTTKNLMLQEVNYTEFTQFV